jgi:hypothetical protein
MPSWADAESGSRAVSRENVRVTSFFTVDSFAVDVGSTSPLPVVAPA